MRTEFYDHANSRQPKENTSLSSPDEDAYLRYEQLEPRLRSSIDENIAAGNYAVAIALIDELISFCPNNALDYNNRGLMHFRNNQLTEALKDLTHALEIDPNLDSAYNNRANCYVAQGDLVAAISDYDQALDINPANIRAWINQGITFRDLESYDLAISNFDICLVLSHNLAERVYGERGRAYHLRGDWNCAVADYQKSLELLTEKTRLASYQQKVQGWLTELLQPVFLN
ncbi:MAG: tetratricopeptide repeat protein [Xenococcaceae cyanobacterium MO_188.B19]|nr:tetratricopeptide repeat protein [Xenococcaceae cyanobacterium MO_188.B19]